VKALVKTRHKTDSKRLKTDSKWRYDPRTDSIRLTFASIRLTTDSKRLTTDSNRLTFFSWTRKRWLKFFALIDFFWISTQFGSFGSNRLIFSTQIDSNRLKTTHLHVYRHYWLESFWVVLSRFESMYWVVLSRIESIRLIVITRGILSRIDSKESNWVELRRIESNLSWIESY
jgi:hypothetical protein